MNSVRFAEDPGWESLTEGGLTVWVSARAVGAPSASEVLCGYQTEGALSFQRFHGQFAIVIADSDRDEVVVGRDAFGFRPLFFRREGAELTFSTNLLRLVTQHTRPRVRALAALMTRSYVDRGESLFETIESVPPGHYGVLSGSRPTELRRYFVPRVGERPSSVDDLDLVLTRSVVASAPREGRFGLQVSGGLDSSLITAMAHRHLPRADFELFHVHTKGHSNDESRFAERLASVVDRPLHEFDGRTPFYPQPREGVVIPDVYSESYEALYRSAHARGVSMLLTGEGSDELQVATHRELEDAVLRRRPREAASTLLALIRVDPLLAARSVARLTMPSAYGRARRRRSFEASLPSWLGDLPRREAQLGYERRIANVDGHLGEGPVRAQLLTELTETWWITVGLHDQQRLAEFCGVTLVHPFYSREVVSTFLALPGRLRHRPGTSKPALRELARRYLPKDLIDRPPPTDYSASNQEAWQRAKEEWLTLLRRPSELARLGLVRESAWKHAVRAAFHGGDLNPPLLMSLRIEAFLQQWERALNERLAHGNSW